MVIVQQPLAIPASGWCGSASVVTNVAVAGIRRESGCQPPLVSVAEHELAPISRLMPTGAAYDQTRSPWHHMPCIRASGTTAKPASRSASTGHPCHRYSGRVQPVASPNAQRSIPGGSKPKLVRAVQVWLR